MKKLKALITVLALVTTTLPASGTVSLTLCCAPDNDLVRLLHDNTVPFRHTRSLPDAISQTPPGSGLLVLADRYPHSPTPITPEQLNRAKQRGLRLYLEFPSALPGHSFGPITPTTLERAVVNSPNLSPDLPPMKILLASGCHYLPTSASQTLLSIARVAGYDEAVYGLPPSASPILFEDASLNALVATTSLSQFRSSRFAPADDWLKLWTALLSRLAATELPQLKSTPVVRAMFGPDEVTPPDLESRSLKLAADWLVSSGLLLTRERSQVVQKLLRDKTEKLPADFARIEIGDGSYGILEGYSSQIRWDGNQDMQIPVRADCHAESAMLLAMNATRGGAPGHADIARRLLDFTYGPDGFCRGARSDPDHPSYGHIAWGLYSPAWEVGNYGDDNARTILATLATATLLDTDAWDEPALRAIAANFRTTGIKGFRGDRLDMPVLEAQGWQSLGQRTDVNLSPHFEAALWACYLLAYDRTNHAPFLEKTRTGIRTMMQAYPGGWRWNDNSERTDMLWTLAWLLRVDDQPEHREWLLRVADDLIDTMQPNGAIPERLSGTGGGHYQVPQSNEAFGVGESPLIHDNNDPVSDQLYTTAFALIALHEAAAVTGNPRIREAEDRLAQYLCRIQVKSEELPYLHGAWLRAFDYEKWDYWANSGDIGWGPWCAETGWGHVWIATTLGLRQQDATLWELLTSRNFTSKWKPIQASMLPD